MLGTVFRVNQKEDKEASVKELRVEYLIFGFFIVDVKVFAIIACRYAENVLLPL